jgi:transcriptional regulator GlxA family with amidase domain
VPGSSNEVPVSAELLSALRAAHARGAARGALPRRVWHRPHRAGRRARGCDALERGRGTGRPVPAGPGSLRCAWCDLGDIVTSAGTAAALDCCLHVLRTDLGAKVAAAVARSLVLAPHRTGSQAQFFAAPIPADPTGDAIADAIAWAMARLAEPVTIDRWCAASAMSRRTFTRRFRERTGSSPQQWLLEQPLDRARVLLETGDASVERVAELSGFSSAVSLRQHLGRQFGVSPREHRAAFVG